MSAEGRNEAARKAVQARWAKKKVDAYAVAAARSSPDLRGRSICLTLGRGVESVVKLP